MRSLLIIIVGGLLLLGGAVFVASEYGGEVVVLRTTDAEGVVHETHLWVVELEGDLWLRSGHPSNAWLARLKQHPRVELERKGKTTAYQAIPYKPRTPDLDAAIAQHYGLADRVISLIRNPADSVAVRLEPALD